MFLTSWERFTRAGVAWPACPGGVAGGARRATSPWASTRQRVFRQRLAVFESEFKSLDDRPSPMAMSGRF